MDQPTESDNPFARALWRIYRRPEAALWQDGGNLPWNDPAFSARMLREHLDESLSLIHISEPTRPY